MTQEKKISLHTHLKSYEEKINEFCQPLREHGIELFTYTRLYKKAHKFLFLSNRDEGYRITLEHELFDYKGFVSTTHLNPHHFTKHIWVGEPHQGITLSEYMHSLGFWNSIDFYCCLGDSIEAVHFGGNVNNKALIDFYLNNSLFFETMIYSFRHLFSKVLEPPDPELLIPLHEQIPDHALIPSPTHFSFLNNQNRFPIIFKEKAYLLPKRQVQCLGLTVKGKTAKEIAREVGLSYRTVEDYMQRLRTKFRCSSTTSLLSSLNSSQISYLLFLLDFI